mgnify:CR=1 FL=1
MEINLLSGALGAEVTGIDLKDSSIENWNKIRSFNAEILQLKLQNLSAVRLPVIDKNIRHAWYKFYAYIDEDKLADEWSRDRIITTINEEGYPAFSGSCSEIYLEKCFIKEGIKPNHPLVNAKKLGETSLMFLVHPTITQNEMDEKITLSCMEIAIKNNIPITNVNENLGGRYSVLSISTFLPLELIGCDWYKIKKSALDFYNFDKKNSFKICSSLINFYMNNYQNGKNISCFMPYTSRLSSFSEWIMQLFGESLGKKNLGGYPVALTPINYLGPKDQHSQLQLVLDGPPDKTMTFFRVNKNEGLNKYSNIEQRATAQALDEVNVPYIEIELEDLNESSLGIIFIIYQIVVSVIGLKLGVNPFDQPAVELIKKKIK